MTRVLHRVDLLHDRPRAGAGPAEGLRIHVSRIVPSLPGLVRFEPLCGWRSVETDADWPALPEATVRGLRDQVAAALDPGRRAASNRLRPVPPCTVCAGLWVVQDEGMGAVSLLDGLGVVAS